MRLRLMLLFGFYFISSSVPVFSVSREWVENISYGMHKKAISELEAAEKAVKEGYARVCAAAGKYHDVKIKDDVVARENTEKLLKEAKVLHQEAYKKKRD